MSLRRSFRKKMAKDAWDTLKKLYDGEENKAAIFEERILEFAGE